MSKQAFKKPVAAAIGAALVGTLSATNVPAADNPFSLQPLDRGYMQIASSENEGKCGEGTKAEDEGKCGEGTKAEGEGKCGEGAKPEEAAAMPEGKCGEGKCGEGKMKE